MNTRQHGFVLSLTLAAAVAAPAFGQTMPSAGTLDAAISIPNLSGIWAHPYWPASSRPRQAPVPY